MEEEDLVLCKVENVTNTVTFVSLPNGERGTIVSSEIAAGRIKFMRDYVVPNKQVVCKVLKIEGDHIHLSLRRVSSKEKKEVMSRYKQSLAIHTAFKQILGNTEEKIRQDIKKEYGDLSEFAKIAKDDNSILEKFIPLDKIDSIKKVLEKRKKDTSIKQNVKISCLEEDGIKKVKELFFLDDSDILVKYISAGNFTLELTVQDFKEGKHKMHQIIEELEKKAKELKCNFNIVEK